MITLQDIQEARRLVSPYVRRTPLERQDSLSRRLGTNVYLKLELFQKTGSFKPRGAFNQVLHLTPEQRERGAVAVSGGNFAQGAAYAGQALGVRTLVCMPAYTPKNYIAATQSYRGGCGAGAHLPGGFLPWHRPTGMMGWACTLR
jgi:threonine dehydratase